MKPNVFLLGAGKCGTTALYQLLAQHQDIHVSKVKEPSFFCSYFQVVDNPISYFRLFDSPGRYRLDASHVYFSNPETPPILKALFPDARFIVILRDPKRRAYSLYRHMRRARHEDGLPLEEIPTFPAALQAEAERYTSQAFFENCRQYFWNFMYCRSSFYDEQLTRYFSLFDRAQFHVLSLADLASDPAETTRRILAFLDLDAAPVEQFNLQVATPGGSSESFCDESNRVMSEVFAGLTNRTDRLVGHALDWSL